MADAHVGVIGAGLIGGSICRSLRAAGVARCRVYSPSPHTVAEVVADGFVAEGSIGDLVATCDVVFVCVPLTVQGEVLREVAAAVRATARTGIIVTDVSSVKGSDARAAVELFANVGAVFIPGHPMAGTENSGFAASTSDMFDGATWVLCPERAQPSAILRLMNLVFAMNARVSLLDVESHDRAVAAVSHLPHVLAASLVNVLPDGDERNLAFRLAAGSFRDVSRVAGSEPWLSSSMVNFNRAEVQVLLDRLRGTLDRLAGSLGDGDSDAVLSFFEHAKHSRSLYDAAKSVRNTRTVAWAEGTALQSAITECRTGAVLRSVSVTPDGWDVVLEH